VLVFRTGIGVERAAASTRAVLDRFPVTGIVNTGCVGALAESLGTGDLIIADRLLIEGGEPGFFEPDRKWVTRLRSAAESAGLPATGGAILTSRSVLATAAAKQAAARRYGAVAVDMEGAAVAEIAAARALPFASVRAVLDTAAADLPSTEGFIEPDGSLRPLRAAFSALRKPAAMPGLMALARDVRGAESSLGRLFRALLRDSSPARTEFDD
jgi:nucleoside phosphorylase